MLRTIVSAALLLPALSYGEALVEGVQTGISDEARTSLAALIASDDRPDRHKARDQYRRPMETLDFCSIDPTDTVVEIWPGGQGGWYRRIIEPLVTDAGGTYIPVTKDRKYLSEEAAVPYGEVDLVLVFRAHGFMIYDKPAQRYVDSLFAMLKPGGTFCIVDHAGDESIPQDPDGENGYVNESHFRAIAEQAGFVLAATSAHNRNAADDKDHPRGVYSLPPTFAGTRKGSDARAEFAAIGESDRFTHLYVKPE